MYTTVQIIKSETESEDKDNILNTPRANDNLKNTNQEILGLKPNIFFLLLVVVIILKD